MHVCRNGRDWDEMLWDRGPEKRRGFSGYFKRIRYSGLKKEISQVVFGFEAILRKMDKRNKYRFGERFRKKFGQPSIFGWMRGTGTITGDIESPDWDGPWDAELGIAYRGENGVPVYYTGNGIETTDDLR